jgi:hypothetical protein
MITEKTLSKIVKKAKKAGWVAGKTPISDLPPEKISLMCGLVEPEGKKKLSRHGFLKKN